MGNTCYINAARQIIGKLYPHIFSNRSDSTLSGVGASIVRKIQNDKGYVTEQEAEAFRDALVDFSDFQVGVQGSADECMDSIWNHLRVPHVDSSNFSSFVDVTTPPSTEGNRGVELSCLLSGDAALLEILAKQPAYPCPYSVLPISVVRNVNGIKSNNNILGTMELQVPFAPYKLIGFVIHFGTARGGHYVTYIQRAGQWKLYNDAEVINVTAAHATAAAEQGYLYFYRQ